METLSVLLEITIYSGILFCTIMLLKLYFKNRMSPFLHFVVWGLLIVRLLLPVTLESSVHLFVIPAGTDSGIVQQTQTSESGTEPILDTNISNPGHVQPLANAGGQTQSAATSSTVTENTATAQQAVSLSTEEILLAVWLTGAGIGVLYLAALYGILRRRIQKKAQPPSQYLLKLFNEVKAELNIKRNVKIVGQCEYGSPAILFPNIMLMPVNTVVSMSDDEVKFVLRHELMHFKRRDHITGLLLSFLTAVYWFNPIVWLAFKQIHADMETACDSDVVRHFSGREKTAYAAVILSLFSGKQYGNLALGMARGDTRQIAEKRIRGVFMNHKSNRKVKVAAIALASLLLFTCFTTACQPTPEEEVIIGKGDGLSDLIQSTPDASNSVSPDGTSTQTNDALYTKLGAPEHWTYETTAFDDKLNITADVDVELPGISQLPAATATLSEFTQEDLDKIAEVLGVGDTVWKETDILTKEMIEELLVQERAALARLKSENNPGEAIMIEKTEDAIKNYEQQYDNAPKASDLQTIDFNIGEVSYGEDRNAVGFKGITQVNNQSFCLTARSAINGQSVRNVYANYGAEQVLFAGTYLDKPYNVSLTKEQAAEQAIEIAENLTDELTLTCVVPAATDGNISRKWGWACVFMREINGCPTAYESTDVGSSMDNEVAEPIPYEKMIIIMDDMGMLGFSWESPMKIKSIDNTNVGVLSFDEIKERAIEQLAQKWIYQADADPGCTVKINKVELGLMRVSITNSNEFYYIPVWNFFAELNNTDDFLKRMEELGKSVSNKSEDAVDAYGNPAKTTALFPQAWGAVTVNALDGSIIDRNLGY